MGQCATHISGSTMWKLPLTMHAARLSEQTITIVDHKKLERWQLEGMGCAGNPKLVL